MITSKKDDHDFVTTLAQGILNVILPNIRFVNESTMEILEKIQKVIVEDLKEYKPKQDEDIENLINRLIKVHDIIKNNDHSYINGQIEVCDPLTTIAIVKSPYGDEKVSIHFRDLQAVVRVFRP